MAGAPSTVIVAICAMNPPLAMRLPVMRREGQSLAAGAERGRLRREQALTRQLSGVAIRQGGESSQEADEGCLPELASCLQRREIGGEGGSLEGLDMLAVLVVVGGVDSRFISFDRDESRWHAGCARGGKPGEVDVELWRRRGEEAGIDEIKSFSSLCRLFSGRTDVHTLPLSAAWDLRRWRTVGGTRGQNGAAGKRPSSLAESEFTEIGREGLQDVLYDSRHYPCCLVHPLATSLVILCRWFNRIASFSALNPEGAERSIRTCQVLPNASVLQ